MKILAGKVLGQLYLKLCLDWSQNRGSAFLKVMGPILECTPKIYRDHMGLHSKKATLLCHIGYVVFIWNFECTAIWSTSKTKYINPLPYVGWIPGILGFSTQMNQTQMLIVDWNRLWKSFRMIPNSPRSSRIFRLKIDFLTFAWAKPWMGSPRKFREYSQQIRWWIWNILIVILWVLLTAVI